MKQILKVTVLNLNLNV